MNATNTLLFLNLSGAEIAIIFLFILLFFGAESIPKMARTMGKVMYQIKNATDDIKRDIKDSAENIKKDITDQSNMTNPIEDVTKEINDSVNETNN